MSRIDLDQTLTRPNGRLLTSEEGDMSSRDQTRSTFRVNTQRRRIKELVISKVIFGATLLALGLLLYLLTSVVVDGHPYLRSEFFTNFPSRFASKAGFKSAIYGSIWLGVMTLFFSVILGVSAAVYLQEMAGKGRLQSWIELSIATLAGVPSIIYGMLGLGIFVRFFAMGRSVIAGALTLSLLVMPVIIIAAREALKSVPDSIRMGAFALGATRWQTVRDHVLPAATPGIATGVILAMARAMGEAAPLIMLGALTYVAFVPESVFDSFTAMPIQIYNWTSRPQEQFLDLAAAGIIVLLGFLVICNSAAIILRSKWGARKP
jgi:phosphate transport system permease protein